MIRGECRELHLATIMALANEIRCSGVRDSRFFLHRKFASNACANLKIRRLWRTKLHDFAEFPVSTESESSSGRPALYRRPARAVSRPTSPRRVRSCAVNGLLRGTQSPPTPKSKQNPQLVPNVSAQSLRHSRFAESRSGDPCCF